MRAAWRLSPTDCGKTKRAWRCWASWRQVVGDVCPWGCGACSGLSRTAPRIERSQVADDSCCPERLTARTDHSGHCQSRCQNRPALVTQPRPTPVPTGQSPVRHPCGRGFVSLDCRTRPTCHRSWWGPFRVQTSLYQSAVSGWRMPSRHCSASGRVRRTAVRRPFSNDCVRFGNTLIQTLDDNQLLPIRVRG